MRRRQGNEVTTLQFMIVTNNFTGIKEEFNFLQAQYHK